MNKGNLALIAFKLSLLKAVRPEKAIRAFFLKLCVKTVKISNINKNKGNSCKGKGQRLYLILEISSKKTRNRLQRISSLLVSGKNFKCSKSILCLGKILNVARKIQVNRISRKIKHTNKISPVNDL